MKHTPTPWRQTKGEFEIVAEIKGEKKLIAVCSEKANAAFIVRACNAHDELVHAAQLALDHYNGKHMGANTVTLLKKAIAKAKGES